MIKLNCAIFKHGNILARNEMNHGVNKRRLSRSSRDINALKQRLISRNPESIRIISGHIAKTLQECLSEQRGYAIFIRNKEFITNRLANHLSNFNIDIIKKISFLTYIFGRHKAEFTLGSLDGVDRGKKRLLEHEFETLTSYKNEILKRFPGRAMEIDDFIRENIALSQEVRESEIEKDFRPAHAKLDYSAVVNLTELNIPEDILLILSFGPKFCFPPRNDLLSTIYFLDDFCGHLENSFPIETHLEAYKQLSIEMNAANRKSKQTREIWLDILNYRIRSFKISHPDIFIARSDKGKHTVLIYKKEYIEKMNKLVLETDDYIRIDSIDLKVLEDKNNMFVEMLMDRKAFKHGACFDSCTFVAQMYGLVKIHKKGYPVRPITAACASPGFALAKFFTELLTNVFWEDGFHVRNSLQFVKGLQDVEIADDEQMISFDVVSMFTNIPIDHMIDLIGERREQIFANSGIEFELFKEIMLFLLKECAVFSWNNTAYMQRDSLAMGSPLSPILAKILMTKLMRMTLPSLCLQPKFLALYVDDSFWIVKHDQIEHILENLNKYHQKIKFTVEREFDSRISFLDVLITRNNGKLLNNWYKKSYASSRLLNYFSHHERSCISETAKAYVRMVLSLSNSIYFHENKQILEEILRNNSFPEAEIDSILRENYTFMKPLPKSCGFSGEYVPIKYRGKLTSKLKAKLTPFLEDARLVGTPDRSNTKHFSYLKDIIPIEMKSNIVVCFSCECKKHMIIRHTQYHKRAVEIIDSVKSVHNVAAGKCSNSQHFFSIISGIQCKSYSSMKRVFNMFAYANKNKLIDTVFCLPEFRISKQINVCIDRNK